MILCCIEGEYPNGSREMVCFPCPADILETIEEVGGNDGTDFILQRRRLYGEAGAGGVKAGFGTNTAKEGAAASGGVGEQR